MKVHIYFPEYDTSHQQKLSRLAKGVEACGDQVQYLSVTDVRPGADCAIIYGSVKKAFDKSWTKQDVLDAYPRRTCIMEMGYVRRDEYQSLGWHGINGRADFLSKGSPPDRWMELQTRLQRWQWKTGPLNGPWNVLLVGQIPWDVSVQHTDHVAWCHDRWDDLRDAGHNVRFRGHPLALKRRVDYGIETSRASLQDDLDWAEVVYTFNSNVGVDAMVQGIPTVAQDAGSMVWSIAHRSLKSMGLCRCPITRSNWAFDLAYSQWNPREMEDGTAWNHIRRLPGLPL